MSEDQYAIYPSLKGKNVLITGGAEGIGAAAVELFARQGSKVIFLDYSKPSAQATIEAVKLIPGATEPRFVYCDVTDLDMLKTAAEEALAQFGNVVHVLVNNAASTGSSSRTPTADVTPEHWQRDIDVNLRHQFFMTQHIALHMPPSSSIINMGSITWKIPSTDNPVYALAKAAIVGMTRVHAREFGERGVRVNSVMPGSIATERQVREVFGRDEGYMPYSMEMQALKRVLVPKEVARVMLFLAAEDSSAVTGSSYCADGGWISNP